MAYQQPSTQGKSSQIREIQNNMVMLRSEIMKEDSKKGRVETEIKKLDKDQDRIKIELQAKQEELKKIDDEIIRLDKSVKDFQKKQNAL